jgi:putative transcriptional regulator
MVKPTRVTNSPTLEIAFQIARVFRVPLDDLFHYPESEEKS